MSLALELLREIDAFVNANGMAETTFGRLATNDGKLVARLRGGKGITTGTVEKIRSYIRDNGPGSAASLSSSAANPAVLERIAGALERLAPTAGKSDGLDAAGAFVWHADDRRLEAVREVNRV